MDRYCTSSPEQVNQAEFVKIYDELNRIHSLVELCHEIDGFEASYQSGISYLENEGKQISIWRDDTKAMCAKITVVYPGSDIQTTSDYRVSYDGSQLSHIQTWPFGSPDDLDSNEPYQTNDLGPHSCGKLKLTLAELDKASKAKRTSLLGRLVARFSGF